ncbi:universal stress protein [Enterococcus sp. DIV0876]|uniref:universal stress protein n=1 Tax=Enterococcus sp. DIV0876 TaxID=2774633 RepID=UPI003D300651
MDAQRYQNILVGIDGSEQAKDAFKKAVEVARRNQGKVYVATIIDQQMPTMMGYAPLDSSILEQEKDTAQNMIDECKAYADSVDFPLVEGVIAYGSIKDALATQLPDQYDIDLIMVGQSGLNAVERFMMGSVASYVIREARCDVLIVSPQDTEKD